MMSETKTIEVAPGLTIKVTIREEFSRDALAVDCPACPSVAGVKCVVPESLLALPVHGTRWDAPKVRRLVAESATARGEWEAVDDE